MVIVAAATFVTGLAIALAAAVIDARTHRLRNAYTMGLAATGIVGLSTASPVAGQPISITSMAVGVAIFCGPWFITHLIAPEAIGFGDIKFTGGLGIYLGWLAPIVAITGFFAAAIVFGLSHLFTQTTSREPVPFGPALLAGAVIAVAVYPLLS